MFRKLLALSMGGFLFAIFFLSLVSLVPSPSRAACGDYFSCNQEIERVKKEIARLKGQANTLANQIAYLTNQIYLTELEIQAKQAEIELLTGDIGNLAARLERIASFLEFQEGIFVARARSAYTSAQLSAFDVVLGADNLDQAVRRIKYLRVLEKQDRETLEEMRETRASFNEQKAALEGKKADVERLKAEVEAKKRSLVGQRAAKDNLLVQTKGQESNYQQILKQLQAELNSILAALRQGGTVVGPVSRGQRITNQGTTGCSTGPHIHYAVGRGPVGSSRIDYFVNPYGFVGVQDGTVVSGSYYSPGGSSNYLTQGAWSGHMALDLVSGTGGVYASESGTAYLVNDTTWGSWCWTGKPYNGPAYGFVIDHGDGYKTLYWHIQP